MKYRIILLNRSKHIYVYLFLWLSVCNNTPCACVYLTAYVHLGFFDIDPINFCHPGYCGFLQQSQDTDLPPKPNSKNDPPMRRFSFLLTLISDKAKKEDEWTQNKILENHYMAPGNASHVTHQGEVKEYWPFPGKVFCSILKEFLKLVMCGPTQMVIYNL